MLRKTKRNWFIVSIFLLLSVLFLPSTALAQQSYPASCQNNEPPIDVGLCADGSSPTFCGPGYVYSNATFDCRVDADGDGCPNGFNMNFATGECVRDVSGGGGGTGGGGGGNPGATREFAKCMPSQDVPTSGGRCENSGDGPQPRCSSGFTYPGTGVYCTRSSGGGGGGGMQFCNDGDLPINGVCGDGSTPGSGNNGGSLGPTGPCEIDPSLMKGPGGICVPRNPFSGGPAQCNTVGCITTAALRVLLGLSGVVAVILIIIGGFQYMLSAGNAETAAKGKRTLLSAVIGLVVIIMSYVIVSAVTGSLTGGDLFDGTGGGGTGGGGGGDRVPLP